MDNTPMGALLAHGAAATVAVLVAVFDTPKDLLDVFRSGSTSSHPSISETFTAISEADILRVCGGGLVGQSYSENPECLIEIAEILEHEGVLPALETEPDNPEHLLSIAARSCRDAWHEDDRKYMELPVCKALTQLLASNP
jgi:hypothetical protein